MTWIYPFTTMSFAYPLLLLAPFLFFACWLIDGRPITHPRTANALLLRDVPKGWRVHVRTPLLATLYALMILFLSIAAARPQRTFTLTEQVKARNLMLALDLSRSMETADVASTFGRMTRIAAVKAVVKDFIASRKGDRIGIVVFGGGAFLQSPLTLDHQLLQQLVDILDTGVAGDGTAIGDGLGLSVKRIQDVSAESRAVILITDGVSNAGLVNPLKAAKVARDLGVKVHTIGIGSTVRGRGGVFGSLMQGGIDAEFDEKTLKEIADLTGGVYQNASDLEGLKRVYGAIDALDRSAREAPEKQITEELFPPYLAIALLTFVVYAGLANLVFQKVP